MLSKGAQLRKHIDATLGSGNLRESVKLPTGEDLNEWLAVNSFGCTDQFMARRFCGLFDSAGFGRHFGSFQDYMVE
ncbi:MOB kinase activator-like 1B [Rosa rugosa]|uniref:MOB kinase activator-like 1B n=1 Tax=Rosa rugosa TaxID=74645 RepID=UPI002B4035A7|nr:MOB kinase activator-like 1B [Rosa rugosa]XP_061994718.1 MOB kinase activator-like 1B [Rosa rugosa]XP_062000523.1 MOB kinase activator-like 1B [Rosa rugosa]XP_062006531.1 MOB kinase activator-like 1B [Rosa rugosa]